MRSFSSKAKKKKVFICFNYDDDNLYRNFLSALKSNSGNDIDFEDATPSEIRSNSVARVKGVLTTKIRESDYTLVLIGEHANEYHDDWREIGERNWQWWEIKKAADEGHKFIALRLKSGNKSPEPLYGRMLNGSTHLQWTVFWMRLTPPNYLACRIPHI